MFSYFRTYPKHRQGVYIVNSLLFLALANNINYYFTSCLLTAKEPLLQMDSVFEGRLTSHIKLNLLVVGN